MTHDDRFKISRRRALAGLGTIGVASAGAGLGTSAYFNDTEEFDGNVLAAGKLDLLIDYYVYENQGNAGVYQVNGTENGSGEVHADISDIKPGDSGISVFCPRIVDNPAYLWFCGDLVANDENGYTEPEPEDENGEGELADAIEVTVGYCSVASDLDANGTDGFDPGDVNHGNEIWSGSLKDFLAAIEFGIPLDGAGTGGILSPGDQDPFAGSGDNGDNPCLCIDWEVPTSVGNEIQTDSMEFDLEFHAQQARHNDGTTNPCASGTGFPSISYEKALNMQALAAIQNNAEIQIHGDSPGVEYDFADKFPANTDISFTAVIDATNMTASLSVLGETVTDTDVTDGTANGASTGDPEWPSGVPGFVDVAINAHSKSGNGVTTVVKDVSVNGGSTLPSFESSGGNTYLAIPGVDTSSDVTVTGTMRFEGAQADFSSQDWVGIDFR